jgi:hypothetical protein
MMLFGSNLHGVGKMADMYKFPAIGKEHARAQDTGKAGGSIPAEVIVGNKIAGGIDEKNKE